MADIQSYERVIKQEAGFSAFRSKFLFIGIYLLIAIAWGIVLLTVGPLASLILLIPLSIAIAVMLTWKYTKLEFEYSFMGGTFTYSKIYGNSRRSTVFEGEITKMISMRAYDDEYYARLEAEGAKLTLAVPSLDVPNPCVCIFEKEKGGKIYLLIDCDEHTAKIFKFFNPSATDRSVSFAFRKTNI